MKGLTQKQLAILDFIRTYIAQHHYSPSYREIMHHFSFASPASVYKYIQTLKRKGVLEGEKQCSRSVLPKQHLASSSHLASVTLPLIGTICAGSTIDLFKQSQNLAIPAYLTAHPENTYLLRVQGDTLQEEAICDGDLLLVEARQEVQAGETIIGLIDQHETVIKRYFPEGQYIRLEGQAHHPLILRSQSLHIYGVLIGLLRSFMV